MKEVFRVTTHITARAPSNIALIKYMGKVDPVLNIPENPSLSLTLQDLCTVVNLRLKSEGEGISLSGPGLSEAGRTRMIHYIQKSVPLITEVLNKFEFKVDLQRWESSQVEIESRNTFPASSGIASSASSFAAVTLAVAGALVQDLERFQLSLDNHDDYGRKLRRALARISRQGSGSSCRSFEGPWVYWEGEDAEALNEIQMPEMAHFVLLVDSSPKKVSSSLAHSMVRSSPLWNERVKRVEERVKVLKQALKSGDIPTVSRIAWSEAWEMHSLFHTCSEPFSYWTPGTIDVLRGLASFILQKSPPIVTLDAGPNVHVIVPASQRDEWRARLKELWPQFEILEDRPGLGARVVSSSDGA